MKNLFLVLMMIFSIGLSAQITTLFPINETVVDLTGTSNKPIANNNALFTGIRVRTRGKVTYMHAGYAIAKKGSWYKLTDPYNNRVKFKRSWTGLSSAAVDVLLSQGNNSINLTEASIPFADSDGKLIEDNSNLTYVKASDYIKINGGGAQEIVTPGVFIGDDGVGANNMQMTNNSINGHSTAGPASVFLFTHDDGATIGTRYNFYRSGGTAAAPTTHDVGAEIGELQFYSYDGGSFAETAEIKVITTEAGSAGLGSKMEFFTAPNGGASTKGMILGQEGTLSLVSTTGAFIPNTLTATQALALTPINGMYIYVTSTSGVFTAAGFWGYDEGTWTKK